MFFCVFFWGGHASTQDAMDLRVRDRLPAALCWSMAGITAFFVSFGAFGYLAYGRDVANFITMVSYATGQDTQSHLAAGVCSFWVRRY